MYQKVCVGFYESLRASEEHESRSTTAYPVRYGINWFFAALDVIHSRKSGKEITTVALYVQYDRERVVHL
jgi:hypothetical protein